MMAHLQEPLGFLLHVSRFSPHEVFTGSTPRQPLTRPSLLAASNTLNIYCKSAFVHEKGKI